MIDESNIKFLQRIQWEKWVTEISDFKHNLWWIDDYENIIHNYQDAYFISFLPNEKRYSECKRLGKPPRTKKEYIKGISYFKADFDIRSYVYEHYNRLLSQDELIDYRAKLTDGLMTDPDLKDYNAVVCSWNGLHVYWIWEMTEIDPETYSKASTALYERIKDIFKDTPELWPDFACSNISRLMRLPWTFNTKKKYWLPWTQVKLIEFSSHEVSSLVTKLSAIAEEAEREEKVRVEKELRKLRAFNTNNRKKWTLFGNKRYDAINHDINIAELVCKYTWWWLAPNWVNFISNKDWCYTGAYVIPEENVVVWKWTPHFKDTFPVYSPYAFILMHYAWGDARETFWIAKEMFPYISPIHSDFLHDKKLLLWVIDD